MDNWCAWPPWLQQACCCLEVDLSGNKRAHAWSCTTSTLALPQVKVRGRSKSCLPPQLCTDRTLISTEGAPLALCAPPRSQTLLYNAGLYGRAQAMRKEGNAPVGGW
eukprot:1159373-Pelagomonas_calceolata.AAC.8